MPGRTESAFRQQVLFGTVLMFPNSLTPELSCEAQWRRVVVDATTKAGATKRRQLERVVRLWPCATAVVPKCQNVICKCMNYMENWEHVNPDIRTRRSDGRCF